MTTVEEARKCLAEAVRVRPAEHVPLAAAAGRFNLHDVMAPYDHPLFDCSAMDGFAFAFAEDIKEWSVVGEVAAGGAFPRALAAGECVRIFTGAMLPQGADTVVMQERVQRQGDRITHTDAKLKHRGNVRPRGDQLHAGEIALKAGSRLDAAAIGLLASVGIREVMVAQRPRVALLISGDEFIEGDAPAPGKIFGSNGLMLKSALQAAGIAASPLHVGDDRRALIAAWNNLKGHHDVIISTGGVSVGDHDLVPPTLRELGAGIHFHGVLQKPGKPLLFAELEGTAVIGLPGNPRAVMVLFMEYVLPFLQAMQGAAHPGMRREVLPAAGHLDVKGTRAEFRAARVSHGRVELLADEGSHMLRNMVEANAIAYIPAKVRELRPGDPVEVHYLP